MANPLDEVTGPHNDEGREVRVIEKQLPVTIGFGSQLFEIAIWLVGFVPAAVVSLRSSPPTCRNGVTSCSGAQASCRV